MKRILSLLTIALATQGISQDTNSFVLVELFTSEGCSSCPPADKLLSEIVEKTSADVEVIGMSFHVDYWDYIGWKDPYASADFTQRQRTYARKFYSNQVYTPQMVVNGKHEFVGSNRAKWNRIFEYQKDRQSDYSLKIENSKLAEDKLVINVSSLSQKRVKLNVALVERDLYQNVTRGENRGRKLSHDNVVREFVSRQFDGRTNLFRLGIPKDLKMEKSSLIVYAQLEDTWEVIAAKKIPLNSIR